MNNYKKTLSLTPQEIIEPKEGLLGPLSTPLKEECGGSI